MSDKTETSIITTHPVLVSRASAAEMLGGISIVKLDELVRDGRIAAKRIDKRVVFELDEVKRFARELPGWEPK